jgi:hypothetical protein
MLLRKDTEGVIAISQPAHAWVSGQLARNWTETDFVGVGEEVCLAAEQHDIGFLEWEQSPTLNSETGLPHTFREMPRRMHLAIWTSGIQQMLRFGRYSALLVSRHFTGLAQRNGHEGTVEEEQLLIEFLERQDAFQTSLKTSLANDFYYGEFSTEEVLRHHQQLVSLWDWMSLILCHGLEAPQTVTWPAWKQTGGELRLTPIPAAGAKVKIEPWPFRVPGLKLVCEGRRLLRAYKNEHEMREGLKAAAPVVLAITLDRG